MALNPFHFNGRSSVGPALGSFAIMPNDSTDLTVNIRAVTINAGGTLSWVDLSGVVQTTAALPAGTYPLLASRIQATGTTATGITGWV